MSEILLSRTYKEPLSFVIAKISSRIGIAGKKRTVGSVKPEGRRSGWHIRERSFPATCLSAATCLSMIQDSGNRDERRTRNRMQIESIASSVEALLRGTA